MNSAPPGASSPDSENAGSESEIKTAFPETPVKGLTRGSLLAGNTFWNLVGTAFPLLVAIFCIPVLKRSLGTDRLGVISLAWVVIGYFGFFDLGLSRALTKLVAEKLGQARPAEIPTLIWTSLALMWARWLIGTAMGHLLVS